MRSANADLENAGSDRDWQRRSHVKLHGPDAAAFAALRLKMENEWTPQMMQTLGIDAAALPIVWDADFLYGPRTAAGDDTYVLCEINVSSVFPIPDQAPAAIARLALARLNEHRPRRYVVVAPQSGAKSLS